MTRAPKRSAAQPPTSRSARRLSARRGSRRYEPEAPDARRRGAAELARPNVCARRAARALRRDRCRRRRRARPRAELDAELLAAAYRALAEAIRAPPYRLSAESTIRTKPRLSASRCCRCSAMTRGQRNGSPHDGIVRTPASSSGSDAFGHESRDAHPAEALREAIALTDRVRYSRRCRVSLSMWAREDPKAALGAGSTSSSDPRLQFAAERIALNAWAMRDPEAMLEYANKLRTGSAEANDLLCGACSKSRSRSAPRVRARRSAAAREQRLDSPGCA